MLTQPRNSDDIFSLPQCDFDGLIFHPHQIKLLRLFYAQREKYSHSVVSLQHRSGNAIYPLKRGLFPRHLRAEKGLFRARTDPRRIQTPHGPEGQKVVQKKLCNLCTIVH
ncbi:Uncharacterised protein [Escherichia coli]|uniref:Uncharacterized protein n=1 Tax=Escherichia coli TaxID=562 RepID=A0A376MVP4_ECOLX|nr:Uncharacterised protein [Escherichia coli]